MLVLLGEDYTNNNSGLNSNNNNNKMAIYKTQ